MSSLVKLLYPGMHIKRWLILLLLGVTFVSLGVAYLMTDIYRRQPFPEYVAYLTLQFIDRPSRGALFVLTGLVVSAVAILQLYRSLLAPFIAGRTDNIVDVMHQYRSRGRGPKIVAIGGGTGLSTLLRGLKEYTRNLTAIVAVADDGGSSGRLRREMGILPPGDFRQCIAALADVEPLMSRLLQYRFEEGDGLEGHSFGNLYLVAMTRITGNFERALRESSRVLAVRGQILPSTLENITLSCEFEDGDIAIGESSIRHAGKSIRRLFLQPSQPPAYPEAIRAILDADLLVIGPGSLFTSVMPNLLVEQIARAIRESRAVKVYVCNVATEPGETDEYLARDHIEALERHVGRGMFQYVLVNSNLDVHLPDRYRGRLVKYGESEADGTHHVVYADVIDALEPARHDPKKLAQSLLRIYYGRTQMQENGHAEVGSDRLLTQVKAE